MRFTYPVDFTTDETGRVVARVPDVVGCVTDGANQAEAQAEAADALEEALCAAMEAKERIPLPSPARGREVVTPGATIAAKAALYISLQEAGMSNTALANQMGVAETEVRRMLDPRHASKMPRLEKALALLGRRLTVSLDAA